MSYIQQLDLWLPFTIIVFMRFTKFWCFPEKRKIDSIRKDNT
jgi:hypothetical protein